jgi:hypothetical protein
MTYVREKAVQGIKIRVIVHWVVMRRFLSIATVLALLFSMASPVLAACTGSGRAATCHAMATPQADPAMHGHHHHEAAPEPASIFSAGESDGKCPMDCCKPGHPRSGAPAVAASTFPPLAVTEQNVHSVTVAFTSAGFSSHTDRGPPAV